MRDYLFFPIVGLVVVAMAVAALAPGPAYQREAMAALGDPETGLFIEGADFAVFQFAEGLSLDLIELPEGRQGARIAAFKPYDLPPVSLGVFLTLPPAFERAFAGQTIRVSVQARRSPANGSSHFLLNYVGGESQPDGGWRDAPLGLDMRTYEFDWTLPESDGAVDYIGIWPDPEGQGRSIEVARVTAWIAGEMPPVGLRPAREF